MTQKSILRKKNKRISHKKSILWKTGTKSIHFTQRFKMVHSKNDNDNSSSRNDNSRNEMSLISLIRQMHRFEDLSPRCSAPSREPPLPASSSLYTSSQERVGSLQDIIREALEITSDIASHSSSTRSNAPPRSHRTRNGGNSTYADSTTQHGPPTPKSSKQ
jgi:hypothetical protein